MDAMISKTKGVMRGVKARLDGFVGVFRTLVEDHAEVTSLIERVQRDPDKRKPLWPTIRAALLAHERAESRELYYVLRGYEATRSYVDHHEAEAKKLDEMIDRLEETPVDNEAWGPLFDELAGAIAHHIHEEESEIFPVALVALGGQRSKELDEAFTATRDRFLHSV
jgi:hypothetical protein